MKLSKMSLAAALLLGANLYAIENVKVSGSASLFYGSDATTAKGAAGQKLFDKAASYADAGVNLGVTADLVSGVSAGATFQGVSTLGLENNLVNGVWSGAHGSTATTSSFGTKVEDASFFSEAWIAKTVGKTTAKVGRQTLETPLVFTATWNITTNTFEGAVVTNEDLPDTKLVGAWIGTSNGTGDDTNAGNLANVTAVDGNFHTIGTDGMYVAGAINNSYAPLTAQAWYYDITRVAKAYWLQADLDLDGILAGVQYVNINSDASAAKDDKALSAMVGYAMKDVATFTAAYSTVANEGNLGVANYATRGQGAGSGSSLYTEMWWWFGTVSQAGAKTIGLAAETTISDIDFYLGYHTCDIAPKGIVAGTNNKVDEFALTAAKSFGSLDTLFALVHEQFGYEGGTPAGSNETLTTFQVYLTYNF